MSPEISVIIPVYNAEEYLRECLDSILVQNFTNFEVLLINDGSTDTSGDICNEYAAKDSRFKVFHQKNAGVSAARNLGMDHANGEWITFVDSDDWISQNYFAAVQSEGNEDWILLNIDRFIGGLQRNHLVFAANNFSLSDFLENYTVYPHFPAPWAKFFRKNIVAQHHLRFHEQLSFGEDALFNLEYLRSCKYIRTFPQAKYFYRDTDNGLSKKSLNFQHDFILFNEVKNAVLQIPFKNEVTISSNLNFLANRVFNSIYATADRAKNTAQQLEEFTEKNRKPVLNFYRKARGRGIVLFFLLKYRKYGIADILYRKAIFKRN